MTTKLECKIGTGMVDAFRMSHKVDGQTRRIVVTTAWKIRSKFNALAKKSPSFRKAMFAGRNEYPYHVGVQL